MHEPDSNGSSAWCTTPIRTVRARWVGTPPRWRDVWWRGTASCARARARRSSGRAVCRRVNRLARLAHRRARDGLDDWCGSRGRDHRCPRRPRTPPSPLTPTERPSCATARSPRPQERCGDMPRSALDLGKWRSSRAARPRSQVDIAFSIPGIAYWATVVGGLAASVAIIAATFPILDRMTGPEVARNDWSRRAWCRRKRSPLKRRTIRGRCDGPRSGSLERQMRHSE